MTRDYVIKVPPLNYLHVLNLNQNVTRLVVGPTNFTCMEHEKLISGPDAMHVVPPDHYVVISDPVMRDESGQAVTDTLGQVKLRLGDQEIRLDHEPFALYPGEKIVGGIQPLRVVAPNSALLVTAVRDFYENISENRVNMLRTSHDSRYRYSGEEWLVFGPTTYIPRIEVRVISIIQAKMIAPGDALKLRAKRDFIALDGTQRKTGEMWLVRAPGAYLCGADEEDLGMVERIVLSPRQALHVHATAPFTDIYGISRHTGQHWLVTNDMTPSHTPDVFEVVVGVVDLVTLTERDYCVIENPIGEDGHHRIGFSEIRIGPCNFFLQPPYEKLTDSGIRQAVVLRSEDALEVMALERFEETADGKTIVRTPGTKWLVYGPRQYWPPKDVQIVRRVPAFLQIEPLNIYLFRPAIPAMICAVIVILLLLHCLSVGPASNAPVSAAARMMSEL